MYNSSYHNTNSESGVELLVSEGKCIRQEDLVLSHMKQTMRGYTRDEIFEAVFLADPKLKHAPVTSAGRALSNLANSGHLVRSNTMRSATIYGQKKQHVYYLVNTQSELF
jgi:hypothetical protein